MERLIVNVELRLPPKDVKETQVVLFVLKHLLFVHATKYGVINTGGRYHPSLSWHNAWLTIIDERVNQRTCPYDPGIRKLQDECTNSSSQSFIYDSLKTIFRI